MGHEAREKDRRVTNPAYGLLEMIKLQTYPLTIPLPILITILAITVVACQPVNLKSPMIEEHPPIASSSAPIPSKTSPKADDVFKSSTPDLPIAMSTPHPAIHTLQPTYTEQPEPSTVVKPHASEIDGRIYAWIDGGYYFSIREPFNGHGLETIIPNALDPNQAILLAFAPYSDRIAYLTIANHAELWIADLDLSKVEKVWIDDIGWLGEIQSRDYLQLAWGPRDNSVILTSMASTPRTVLYNITTKTAERISGACDQIGLPPVFKQPTLVCIDKTSSSRFYLPGDGTQEVFSTGIILPTTAVQNWAFSPDGTRVLFATEQNNLGVTSDDGRQMSLPYTYHPPVCCGIELMRDDLQWSQDGTRLLTYGREPKAKNPRWYVLDANLGEPVWTASPEDVVRALENQLSVAFDMALSPDGLWIVTSYFDKEEASRYMAIISLTTGQEIEINESTVDLLIWVDH
jgi:hypothetical protein